MMVRRLLSCAGPRARMGVLAFVGWLAWIGCTAAWAQAASPSPSLTQARRITFATLQAAADTARIKEALQTLALEHPEVRSARAAARTSDVEVERARKARFPRLKVGTAAGSYNSGVDGTPSRSYQLVSAEARMSLVDGGAMSARVRAAEAGSQAQEDAWRTTSQKVVLDAITAYLQVQRYDLQREVAAHASRIVDELARAEQRRVALGASGQSDLRMAVARRASIAARESDFEAKRGEALAKFESYFGFVPDPARLPTLSAPAAWLADTQAQALRRAEERSTELAEGLARVERAQAQVDQQKASLWPSVDAVMVKTRDPRGVSPAEPTRLALELNWNFGNGFDRHYRVKSALAELESQHAKLEGTRRTLFEATSSAFGRTASGRQRERRLLEAVRESGKAFAGRRRLLQFGRETLPNVLSAQLDHFTLMQDYVDAVFDQRISEFRLARATGELREIADESPGWVDRLLSRPPGSLLDKDGVLGLDCLASSRVRCAPGGKGTAAAGAAAPASTLGPVLRLAVRLAGR